MTPKVLKDIISKLKNINYAFLGSFNLYLQGIKVEFNDIDILTDSQGIKKIAQIFNSKLSNKNHYLETSFKIDNFPIHVISNKNNAIQFGNFKKEIILVKNFNLKIPAMSLESELKAYKKMGHKKDIAKVNLIERKLSKNR